MGVFVSFAYSMREYIAEWCEKSIITSALSGKSDIFSYIGKSHAAAKADAFISTPATIVQSHFIAAVIAFPILPPHPQRIIFVILKCLSFIRIYLIKIKAIRAF